MKLIKNIIIFVLIILLVLLSSCKGYGNVEEVEYNDETVENYVFGINLDQFNLNFKLPDNQELIKISDKISYGDELIVNYEMEPLIYDIDGIDWNIQYTESPSTFQLYLQSLNSIVYLTKSYEISKNEDYLDTASKIIKRWVEYENNMELSGNNSFVWYDHGTALRAENLIYFALVAQESDYLNPELKSLIIKLLEEHGEYLSNNVNYTENHNHGIFQDRSLIYVSYFLNNENKEMWLDIAKRRLEKQKEFAFTEEMVHVENSPGYQIGVMDIFRTISEFLIQFDDEYGNNLFLDIKDSAEFMAYITKPNGLVAEIGDTNSLLTTSSISNSKMTVFNNDHLSYASTKGELGIKPEKNSKIFPKSGYFIGRSSWERENFEDSTWTMFKSGYSSKTHKHADDLSFMLYSKGYDIFVDTGWYNYITGNRYRDYFVSSLSHNTIAVDEKTYSPTEANSTKAGVAEYEINDNYDYVAGFNNMYNSVKIDRHFYHIGDAIIIYDNILSDTVHNYSQLFHASEYMEIISHSNNEVLLKISDTGYYVRVTQLLNNTELNIIKGDFDKQKYGYISRTMNQIDSINTLKFDVKGDNVDIVTLITIEDNNGNIYNINNINFNKDNMEFSVEPTNKEIYNISLSVRDRMNLSDISIISDNNNFKFINNCYISPDYTYAWYVIDKKSAKVIYNTNYLSDNTFSYKFDSSGNYLVKSYMKDKYGNRISAIVSEINFDSLKNQFNVITQHDANLNLKYNGHSYIKLNEKEYEFTIDYDYSWNTRIKWYIYRNGGYYTNLTTDNENTLKYIFEEPGNYTVMYYLTTPNGDNEFWNFEQIEIK